MFKAIFGLAVIGAVVYCFYVSGVSVKTSKHHIQKSQNSFTVSDSGKTVKFPKLPKVKIQVEK